MQSLINEQIKMMSIWDIFFTIHETVHCGVPLESPKLGDSNRWHKVQFNSKLRKNVTNLQQIFFTI